jgi:hypothetical protein
LHGWRQHGQQAVEIVSDALGGDGEGVALEPF